MHVSQRHIGACKLNRVPGELERMFATAKAKGLDEGDVDRF